MEVSPKKYLSIKEAAVAYKVSRTKIHRLVKSGAVRSSSDPRDDRITLVSVDDLDNRFHGETVMDMNSAATPRWGCDRGQIEQNERHPCGRCGDRYRQR